jgi:hypothetical protein
MKLLWAISLLAFCASTCLAVPTYRIEALGLTDIEHTRSDGHHSSHARVLNEAGQVVGISRRYNGATAEIGRSVWLYDGTTINVSPTGTEFTRSDGYEWHEIEQFNEAGFVLGSSDRFNGSSIEKGYAVWLYDGHSTKTIGLADIEHTSPDGYRKIIAEQMNRNGVVIGTSERYSDSTSTGLSAWLHDGTATINIGLTGMEQTSSQGRRVNFPEFLAESGEVVGWAYRFNGSTLVGRSAWLFDGTNTIELGLLDQQHTRNDGYRWTSFNLNQAGQISGGSYQFGADGTGLGHDAWFYQDQATTQIGFFGNEHTRSDGYRWSAAQAMNQAGQVFGRSFRYAGSSPEGQDIWTYMDGEMHNIGLVDIEHQGTTGYRYSELDQINEQGFASGIAHRLEGTSRKGQSAWLYDGHITLKAGLVDDEHTRQDGFKHSEPTKLSESGQLIGLSKRFSGGNVDLGQSAWLANGTSTVRVGLTGPEYTRQDGYRFSEAQHVFETGQVIGISRRYNGGNSDLGESVWYATGVNSINIGLAGTEHTRADGYKFSELQWFNGAGQVAGISYRFVEGSEQIGQDAWFYDPTLNQTFQLNLATQTNGYSYSFVTYFGGDGLVLGIYDLVNEYDQYVGGRAFYFTTTTGVQDLGLSVDGGLTSNGWSYLADAVRQNRLGQIVGTGSLNSQSSSSMAYLLTPITADYNNDGHVDGRDFLAWQRGESPRPLSAEDLALWQEQYGGGNSLNAVSAVPEPHSLTLVLCSLLLATRVRVR